MKIERSVSGLFWDVIYAGRMVERFDTKRQAKNFIREALRSVRI